MTHSEVYDELFANLVSASEWIIRQKMRWTAKDTLLHPFFLDPERTWVDRRIKIGADAVIFSGCVLMGRKTRIGKACIIFPNVTLIDTVVEDGAMVGIPIIKNAVIGERCMVGWTAELNRTKLGKRVAAKHHSFLGDTQVMDLANIGAGTITANYDGGQKKPTKIGKGAFIGIHSNIVAPRKIGKEAMTGAGAVITKDIPPHTIMVGLNKKLPGTFHKTAAGWEKRERKRKQA